MKKFPLAEKFKAPQGEGVYTGTPMAFIRLVGCSVGQRICTSCDTDFLVANPTLGGGNFDIDELGRWIDKYKHVCITGGEPLDRDLSELLDQLLLDHKVHIETSGTQAPGWFSGYEHDLRAGDLWLTVSPKPGYLEEMIDYASEIKLIVGGLGDGPGWPGIEEALQWADQGKIVFLQPRNLKFVNSRTGIEEVLKLIDAYPMLRMSVQLHKFLNTR